MRGTWSVTIYNVYWLELIFWLEFKVWVDPNELEYKPLSYEHFFRDHNNLVIPKKRKKNSQKNIFYQQYYKNFYNSKNTQDGK